MRAGISLEDIETLADEYDFRILPAMAKEAVRHETSERIKRKIDMAEAFNHAYLGSRFDKYHRGANAYKRWFTKNTRLLEKLEGRRLETIWPKLRRSRKL